MSSNILAIAGKSVAGMLSGVLFIILLRGPSSALLFTNFLTGLKSINATIPFDAQRFCFSSIAITKFDKLGLNSASAETARVFSTEMGNPLYERDFPRIPAERYDVLFVRHKRCETG